jgi:hypothetical protein
MTVPSWTTLSWSTTPGSAQLKDTWLVHSATHPPTMFALQVVHASIAQRSSQAMWASTVQVASHVALHLASQVEFDVALH